MSETTEILARLEELEEDVFCKAYTMDMLYEELEEMEYGTEEYQFTDTLANEADIEHQEAESALYNYQQKVRVVSLGE